MDGGFTWLGSNERSPDNKLSSIFSTKSKKTYAPFTRTSLPPYWRTITKDSSLASIANSTNMAPMSLSFESLQGVIASHLLQLFVYSRNFSIRNCQSLILASRKMSRTLRKTNCTKQAETTCPYRAVLTQATSESVNHSIKRQSNICKLTDDGKRADC